MKKLLSCVLLFACSAIMMAQDDINLLDLVGDQKSFMPQTSDSLSAPEVAPSTVEVVADVPTDEYDWRERRSSLSFTAGTPSLLSGTTGIIMAIVEAFDDPDAHIRIYGSYGVHYGYNVLSWLRVGGSLSCTGFSETRQYSQRTYIDRTNEFIMMAKVDFTYLNRRHVRIYSGIGAGLDVMWFSSYINGQLQPEDEDHKRVTPLPAFTVTPIGIEAGGKRVYGLAEINVGTIDLLRAGVGVRF